MAKLIAFWTKATLISQKAKIGQQRQIPSLVRRQTLVRVRGTKPKPRPTKLCACAPETSRAACGLRNASAHGLTLWSSRFVTKLIERQPNACVVAYAEKPLWHSGAPPAVSLVTLTDKQTVTSSGDTLTRSLMAKPICAI